MVYELFYASNNVVVDTLMNLFGQIDAHVKTEQSQLRDSTGSSFDSMTHTTSDITENKDVLGISFENRKHEIKDMSRLKLEYENELNELESRYTVQLDELKKKISQLENQAASAPVVMPDGSFSIDNQIKILKEQTIGRMENIVNKLLEGSYIIACDETTEAEAKQMEMAILNGAESTLQELRQLDISKTKTVAEVQTLIQNFFMIEMEPISSWMRKLAIYSAYAGIPFMIDGQRTIGVRFDRERTICSYSLLDDMLASIGVKQIVPAPFVELITDGYYIDVTDTATKNIRFLCPDYKKHISRVDRIDTTDMIIDIADVGLMIDGELLRQASVIL